MNCNNVKWTVVDYLRHSKCHYSVAVTSLTVATYSKTTQNAECFSINCNFISCQSGRYRTTSRQPKTTLIPFRAKLIGSLGTKICQNCGFGGFAAVYSGFQGCHLRLLAIGCRRFEWTWYAAVFLDNMPLEDKGCTFLRNDLPDDTASYLRRSKSETTLIVVTLLEDFLLSWSTEGNHKVLRIVVLPIPNHDDRPLHRGGISDTIIFFERKVQEFVLRICRPRRVYADATRSVREVDIHLFVLQGDSALLSHLQSSWWATLMVSLMPEFLLQINACPAVWTRIFFTVNTKSHH